VGVHRDDGSYVVERRGADSAGHRKVFGGFDEFRRLFDRLPVEFTAEDVDEALGMYLGSSIDVVDDPTP
jgi:hypothetical protein